MEPVTNNNSSILIVDDHVLLADTVSSSLEGNGEFHVDCVKTIAEALKQVENGRNYDVVLLDYDMPGTSGLAGMRELMKVNVQRIAIFSGVAGRAVALEAIDSGAVGFIPKTLPLQVLRHALRFIIAGETYVPSSLFLRASSSEDAEGELRPREEKVLVQLAEGLQNKEIARETGLTETTVKNIVKTLCRKLVARNRTELVMAARRMGLV